MAPPPCGCMLATGAAADLLRGVCSAAVVQHARAAAVGVLRGAGAAPDVGHLPARRRFRPGTSNVPKVPR